MSEIRNMAEKPDMVIFCSYAFDSEASKDIDTIKISGLQILKAQMNTDLLTKDLKKKVNTKLKKAVHFFLCLCFFHSVRIM